MATVYFGARFLPTTPHNGNWGDVQQWYSNEGDVGVPATPLGRIPSNSDAVILHQNVLSNVGNWVGEYPAGSYVAGSFAGNVTGYTVANPKLQINTNATFSGTVFNADLRAGTYTGIVQGCFLGDITVSGTVTAAVTITANPIITGTITNVGSFTQTGGTWTYPLTTAWGAGTTRSLTISGGVFNPSSLDNTKYIFVELTGGTIIPTDIFTGEQIIRVIIGGGANLSAFSNPIVLGTPTKAFDLRLQNGSNLNYVIYQDTNQSDFTPCSAQTYIQMVSGVFTGQITVIPLNGRTIPPRVSWLVPTVEYNPTYTIALVNKAGGTGKGLPSNSILPAYDAPIYNPNIFISGSSDILQSGLL